MNLTAKHSVYGIYCGKAAAGSFKKLNNIIYQHTKKNKNSRHDY
jgi:hypothetical protein